MLFLFIITVVFIICYSLFLERVIRTFTADCNCSLIVSHIVLFKSLESVRFFF